MKMKNILKYIKSIYFLMYKSVCWMVWKALVSIDAIDLYIHLFMRVELISIFCVGKKKCQRHKKKIRILTESKTHIEEK